MYENIGEKIKNLAATLAGIGVVASLAAGFIMISSDYSDINTQGWIILVGGPIISWVSSYILYGFGELISQTNEMNQKLSVLLTKEASHDTSSFSYAEKPTSNTKKVGDDEFSQIEGYIVSKSPRVAAIYRNVDLTICPFCNSPQASNRDDCFHCGAKFLDVNELDVPNRDTIVDEEFVEKNIESDLE